MSNETSTAARIFVGNGRVVHAGITGTTVHGVAFTETRCGAEGGRGRSMRSRMTITEHPVTCARCNPALEATTKVAAAKAPVQTDESIRASRVRAAVAYRDDYRAMIRGIEARGEAVPAHLHEQVAKFQARIDENGGE